MSEHILIVDDDRELCNLLQEFLCLEGFRVSLAHDGQAALRRLREETFDTLVLDIMLPGMQGLTLLRTLRQHDSTPVLMLTARGDDTDRIVGLELGADDYLPKPCNPRELSARLRAILRRTRHARNVTTDMPLEVGEARLDPTRRSAHWAGHDLGLTSAEFNILQVLMEHAGTVVDKETLSRQALQRPLTAYDRSVDVHVSRIRRKFADCGADNPIASVRGAGYQFTLPPEEP